MTKSKALATRRGYTDTELAKRLGMYDNRGYGLRDDDYGTASLVITQGNSEFHTDARDHAGYIFNFQTRTFHDSVLLVFAKIVHVRTFKDEKKNILCASPNEFHPLKEYVGKQYDGETIPALCSECPFGASKECRERYRYYGFIVPEDNPGAIMRNFSYTPIFSGYNQVKALNVMLKEDEDLGVYNTYRFGVEAGKEWWTNTFERESPIEDQALIEGIEAYRNKLMERTLNSVASILREFEK